MKCSICDTAIDNIKNTQFCPVCGWELIVIPENASDELKRFFKEKEELHKKNYLKYKESVAKLPVLTAKHKNAQNENLLRQKEIDRLRLRKQQLQQELKKMDGKIRLATVTKNNMEKSKQHYEQKQHEVEELKKNCTNPNMEYYDMLIHIIHLHKIYSIKR
jgi:rRNA maturation endonuclease Nob1